MKLCQPEMRLLPSYLAMTNCIGPMCLKSVPQRGFSLAIFCESPFQNPSWDNLWCNLGTSSALHCQFPPEKESALSQESNLMVAGSAALLLSAGEL